jgi:hypothetical protein
MSMGCGHAESLSKRRKPGQFAGWGGSGTRTQRGHGWKIVRRIMLDLHIQFGARGIVVAMELIVNRIITSAVAEASLKSTSFDETNIRPNVTRFCAPRQPDSIYDSDSHANFEILSTDSCGPWISVNARTFASECASSVADHRRCIVSSCIGPLCWTSSSGQRSAR